jgi:hypothetical protein
MKELRTKTSKERIVLNVQFVIFLFFMDSMLDSPHC